MFTLQARDLYWQRDAWIIARSSKQQAACYGDSFTFLYVDDVRTSQEARPVTGLALLFYMWMMFVPHRKHGLLLG
jgi:hypothetical protein